MKKISLLLITGAFSVLTVGAQTILDDWETSGTRNVNYYNSGGGANYAVSASNPNASGINTSAEVGQYDRVAGAGLSYQLLGSAWSVPTAWSTYDLSLYDVFHLDVYAAQSFVLRLTIKDDDGAGGGTDLQSVDMTYAAGDVNTWKTLDFDFSAYKNYTPSGKVQVLFLFDPGSTSAATYYMDNFRATLSSVSGTSKKINTISKLNQNTPNPCMFTTDINYTLKQATQVNLTVYDVMGNVVEVLLKDEFYPAGDYTYTLNTSNLKEGIYNYTLLTGNLFETKKMVVQK